MKILGCNHPRVSAPLILLDFVVVEYAELL